MLFRSHPGATKMYQDLKNLFWWPRMKSDVARFVYACLTCQKLKVEHQKPEGSDSALSGLLRLGLATAKSRLSIRPWQGKGHVLRLGKGSSKLYPSNGQR